MNFKFFRKKSIEFTVYNKPPQKSQWGEEDAGSVVKLREAALKARNDAGYDKHIQGKIQLHVIIWSPITYDRSKAQHAHLGDLDSLISGICDYLHKGPKDGENNFKLSPSFNGKEHFIGPEIPLIIEDDSQITKIIAEKRESQDQTYYHVKIDVI